jgi:hypothetical protein
MVSMGKTSLLTDVLYRETRMNRWGGAHSDTLAGYDALKARENLLDILLAYPTEQLQDAVQLLARRQEDQLSFKARHVLQSGAAKGAAASRGTVHA